MTAELTPQFREDMAVLADAATRAFAEDTGAVAVLPAQVCTEEHLADVCDAAGLAASVQRDGSIIYADDAIDIWAHADGIDFTDGRAGGTLDYGLPGAVIADIIVAVRKAARQ